MLKLCQLCERHEATYVSDSGDLVCRSCLVSNLRYGFKHAADDGESLSDWITSGIAEATVIGEAETTIDEPVPCDHPKSRVGNGRDYCARCNRSFAPMTPSTRASRRTPSTSDRADAYRDADRLASRRGSPACGLRAHSRSDR